MLENQAKSTLTTDLNVSRETMQDLCRIAELLKKWNKTINLVGKSTIDEVWGRHILDSAQMWTKKPNNLRVWVDLGSGGGFPALVLAAIAKDKMPGVKFHLIESDARKCAFLRNVSRETSLNTEIHNVRIENAEPIVADVVSARALASVDGLLELSQKFLADNTFCLFLKGQACARDVAKARESWCFQSETTKSMSDDTGTILKVWNIKRA
jgi:16S rRNA (guanine527-N7)-methyltransferase